MVFSIVERFELKAARTTKMFSGIPETLKALRAMNLKLALWTISGERSVDHILRRFDLEQFFDAVIPRESVSAVKPDPTHLEAALAALKVRSMRLFWLETASRRGLRQPSEGHCIGVTTGFFVQGTIDSSWCQLYCLFS